MKVKEFTKEDWYGWAGAEPFDDGHDPYFGEIELTGFGDLSEKVIGNVIVDSEGIAVYAFLDDFEASDALGLNDGGFHFEWPGEREEKLDFIEEWPEVLSMGELGQMGFEPVNFTPENEAKIKEMLAAEPKAEEEEEEFDVSTDAKKVVMEEDEAEIEEPAVDEPEVKEGEEMPDEASPTYGGAEFNLPANHVAAFKVPSGGAMCSNCAFFTEKGNTCSNPDFIAWNGAPEIPESPDEYCSDWYEPMDKPGDVKEVPDLDEEELDEEMPPDEEDMDEVPELPEED